MSKHNLTLSTLLLSFAFCVSAQADTPNFEPGEWETTTVTTIEGPVSIPAQEYTFSNVKHKINLKRV